MDAAIGSAIKALRERRDGLDRAIQYLESLDGAVRPAQAVRKAKRRVGKPMSAAVKAKLRAIYAKNHPGWKPKKK